MLLFGEIASGAAKREPEGSTHSALLQGDSKITTRDHVRIEITTHLQATYFRPFDFPLPFA